MKILLKYDFYYLKKTSKFIVFPIVIILFAIISPLSARYLNEFLEFTLKGTGILINFPEPTIFDSYVQYFGNLFEIYLYVIIFISVGMFINDKTKGLLPLILSKPINRTKYILSKYISISILILISIIIGYFVFDYYTYFIFDEIDMLGMFYASLLYFTYILFILSITMFASTHFKSYLTAIFFSFGMMFLTLILSIIEVSFFIYLPGVLINNALNILGNIGIFNDVIINVFVTLVISLLLLLFSIIKFNKHNV